MNKFNWRLKYWDSLTFKYRLKSSHCKKGLIYWIHFLLLDLLARHLNCSGLSQEQSNPRRGDCLVWAPPRAVSEGAPYPYLYSSVPKSLPKLLPSCYKLHSAFLPFFYIVRYYARGKSWGCSRGVNLILSFGVLLMANGWFL